MFVIEKHCHPSVCKIHSISGRVVGLSMSVKKLCCFSVIRWSSSWHHLWLTPYSILDKVTPEPSIGKEFRFHLTSAIRDDQWPGTGVLSCSKTLKNGFNNCICVFRLSVSSRVMSCSHLEWNMAGSRGFCPEFSCEFGITIGCDSLWESLIFDKKVPHLCSPLLSRPNLLPWS